MSRISDSLLLNIKKLNSAHSCSQIMLIQREECAMTLAVQKVLQCLCHLQTTATFFPFGMNEWIGLGQDEPKAQPTLLIDRPIMDSEFQSGLGPVSG